MWMKERQGQEKRIRGLSPPCTSQFYTYSEATTSGIGKFKEPESRWVVGRDQDKRGR